MALDNNYTGLFQSTPLREGRPSLNVAVKLLDTFQSTPLREGRPRNIVIGRQAGYVSIHAPARGATYPTFVLAHRYMRFNPRPCARGDLCVLPVCECHRLFQSTPLREGRQRKPNIKPIFCKFQSTPLREGRPSAAGLR